MGQEGRQKQELVREAARRKPHLFSQTEEEVAARDSLADCQEEICLGIEQQASTSSTILEGMEEKGTMTKGTQKEPTDVIYRGMELRPPTTSSILAWRKKEGTFARETPGAPQEEIYQRSVVQAGTTSSILACTAEYSGRGETSPDQGPWSWDAQDNFL